MVIQGSTSIHFFSTGKYVCNSKEQEFLPRVGTLTPDFWDTGDFCQNEYFFSQNFIFQEVCFAKLGALERQCHLVTFTVSFPSV